MNTKQEKERQRQLQLLLPEEIYQDLSEHLTFYTPMPTETFDMIQKFLTDFIYHIILECKDNSTNNNNSFHMTQSIKQDRKLIYSNFTLGDFYLDLNTFSHSSIKYGLKAMLQYSNGSIVHHNDIIIMFICFENNSIIKIYKNDGNVLLKQINNGFTIFNLLNQDLTIEHLDELNLLMKVFKQNKKTD